MHDLIDDVARHGVLFIFLNVLLEQLGVPIPAVPTLVVAGALAADGRLSGAAILASAFVATLLADGVWFALGRRHGRAILKLLCRVSLSPDGCVRETEGRFERWGLESLLIAKFVPGFSTVAPPLAGAARIPFWRFLVFTAGGTLLWAGSAIGAGMVFHRTVDRVLAVLASLGTAAVYVLGAALALYIAGRWWRRWLFVRKFRMARIRPEELNRLMSEGRSPVVVDVRGEGSRRRDPRSVPGALVMQAVEFEAAIAALPRTQEIVLYCT